MTLLARCDRCGREEPIRLDSDGDWQPWVPDVGNDVWTISWVDDTVYCGRPCAPSDWGRQFGPHNKPSPTLTAVSVAYQGDYERYMRERTDGFMTLDSQGQVYWKFTKEEP